MAGFSDTILNANLIGEVAFAVCCTIGALAIACSAYAAIRCRVSAGATAAVLSITLALTALFFYLYNVVFRPFNMGLDLYLFGAFAVIVLASGTIAVARGQRGKASAGLLLAVLCTVGLTNYSFQFFPTPRSIHPTPVSATMSFGEFQALTSAPRINNRDVGALVEIPLSATQSHFGARPSLAYIPPAYWSGEQLPVVVLLAGNPGTPEDWFVSENADQALDAYQLKHKGRAPIVVSVDATGSLFGNPLCVDGPIDKVSTWLTKDVPAGLKHTLRVNPDQQRWTIGGLSYGGTCALQTVTNSPESYGTFLDFSGEWEPTTDSRQDAINRFFKGDERAYLEHNPVTLLQRSIDAGDGRYSNLAGRFVAGTDDPAATDALKRQTDLARRAGIEAQYHGVPGGHTAQVWRIAFKDSLEFAAQRGGL